MSMIRCPKCGEEFEIDAAMEDRVRVSLMAETEEKVKAKEAECLRAFEMQKDAIAAEAAQRERERTIQVHSDLEAERKRSQELMKTLEELTNRMSEMKMDNEKVQFELRRKLLEEQDALVQKGRDAQKEESDLRMREMEKKLEDTKAALEVATRKAEQGSMKNQGEVLELELEEVLGEEFLFDSIEEVKSGMRGADVKQFVRTNTGRRCGMILWEAKNAANWSGSWIPKLRQDMTEARADIGVLVSVVLPDGVSEFTEVDGIWVVKPSHALDIARVLRSGLMELERMSEAIEGRDAKTDMMFRYVTGPEFRNRIMSILQSHIDAKEALEAEKRATEKRWAKQSKALEAVIQNTARLYGDFQGIVGPSMGDIPLLGEGDEDD